MGASAEVPAYPHGQENRGESAVSSFASRFNSGLRVLRLTNCAMTFAGVLIGGFIGAGLTILGVPLGIPLLVAAFCGFLFVGAGNALNDYYDFDVDAVAHPERPIPKGELSRQGVLGIAIVLFVAANALGILVTVLRSDLLPAGIVLVSTLVMLGYERLFKDRGFPGNLVASLLVGVSFLFGGAVVGNWQVLFLPAVLAATANLGREIVKDVEDIRGDKVRRVTLPTEYGVPKATFFAVLALSVAIALSPLPYALRLFDVKYLLLVLVADGVFIYAISLALRDARRAQQRIKHAMMIALVAFIAGTVPLPGLLS